MFLMFLLGSPGLSAWIQEIAASYTRYLLFPLQIASVIDVSAQLECILFNMFRIEKLGASEGSNSSLCERTVFPISVRSFEELMTEKKTLSV